MTTTPFTAPTVPLSLHHAFYVGLHALAREWGYTVPHVSLYGFVGPAESEWGDVEWLRIATEGTGNYGHFVPIYGRGRGSQFVKAYKAMKAALVADFCGVGHQTAAAILRVKYAHDSGVIEQAVQVAEEWGALARHLEGWEVPECPESHRGMDRVGVTGPFSHPRKTAIFRIAAILVRVR